MAAPPPLSGDTAVSHLFANLAATGGRRAEKDAVLVAVWLLSRERQEVRFAEVADLLAGQSSFSHVRVKPHLLKHVSRTHLLEPGAERESVRLSAKGRRAVARLMQPGRSVPGTQPEPR